MRHFHISVDIAAPADHVWAIMRDFERWPEWTPTVTSITRMNQGPIAPGAKLLIRQPKFPPAIWKLTEIQGTSFVWVTTGPGVKVWARHFIEPDTMGSKVTLSLEFAGPLGGLLGSITSGLNERYLQLEANGLKQRSEASLA
jgi:uncharacterized membrane protein